MRRAFLAVIWPLLLCATASAVPIRWDLSTLNFNVGAGFQLGAGGVASGFFTYDADTNTYSGWNIVISDFGFAPANGTLTPATSLFYLPPTATNFTLSYSSSQALLILGFFEPGTFNPAPLSDTGGLVGVSATVVDAGNAFYSWFASGTAASVPEPASASFALLGGVVLCLVCLFLHQWASGRKGARSSLPARDGVRSSQQL